MAEKREKSVVLGAQSLRTSRRGQRNKKPRPTRMSFTVQPRNKSKMHTEAASPPVILLESNGLTNATAATCSTFQGLFCGMVLHETRKLGSIPPRTDQHGLCPKLPKNREASAVLPFVVFCLRLPLWHRSSRFTVLSCGHGNLSCIYPAFPTVGDPVSCVSQSVEPNESRGKTEVLCL